MTDLTTQPAPVDQPVSPLTLQWFRYAGRRGPVNVPGREGETFIAHLLFWPGGTRKPSRGTNAVVILDDGSHAARPPSVLTPADPDMWAQCALSKKDLPA